MLILVGLVLLISSISSFFPFSNKEGNGKEFKRSVQSIEQLRFKSTAADWEIETYDGEEIVVQLEDERRRAEIQTVEHGNGLEVAIKERSVHLFNFSFWRGTPTVYVLVPRSYEHRLDLETVSGNINIEGELRLDHTLIKTVSGDFNASRLNGGEYTISTVSGDIHAGPLHVEKVKLNSTSGDLYVEELSGNIEGKTTSGDILIAYDQENSEALLKTISGDISLLIPKANANLSLNTTSGDLIVNPELKDQSRQSRQISGKIGDGVYPVELSTTSGDIHIQ